MSELAYLISVLAGLGSLIAGAVLLWAAVEGVYFIYCRVSGREY